LANLNQHWTTAYWSQTYSDWSQISFPTRGGNPGLLLEHKHFVTATWRSFQRNQINVLRPIISRSQFITTNRVGLHGPITGIITPSRQISIWRVGMTM